MNSFTHQAKPRRGLLAALAWLLLLAPAPGCLPSLPLMQPGVLAPAEGMQVATGVSASVLTAAPGSNNKPVVFPDLHQGFRFRTGEHMDFGVRLSLFGLLVKGDLRVRLLEKRQVSLYIDPGLSLSGLLLLDLGNKSANKFLPFQLYLPVILRLSLGSHQSLMLSGGAAAMAIATVSEVPMLFFTGGTAGLDLDFDSWHLLPEAGVYCPLNAGQAGALCMAWANLGFSY